MYIDQLLIEGYCNGDCGNSVNPCNDKRTIGVYCFLCSHFSYTESPNGFAYSNAYGLIESEEDWVGFGGEMFPQHLDDEKKCIEIWHKICRKKIAEAYDEYMKSLDSLNNREDVD